MKRKESLILMELLIMLGVFALSCAICLRLLADAAEQSRKNIALDYSVLEACNAAEILRHTGGDFARAAELYGGSWDGSRWQIGYDDSWAATKEAHTYLLTAVAVHSTLPTLGKGEITVHTSDGHILYTITVAWQKKSGVDAQKYNLPGTMLYVNSMDDLVLQSSAVVRDKHHFFHMNGSRLIRQGISS